MVLEKITQTNYFNSETWPGKLSRVFAYFSL